MIKVVKKIQIKLDDETVREISSNDLRTWQREILPHVKDQYPTDIRLINALFSVLAKDLDFND